MKKEKMISKEENLPPYYNIGKKYKISPERMHEYAKKANEKMSDLSIKKFLDDIMVDDDVKISFKEDSKLKQDSIRRLGWKDDEILSLKAMISDGLSCKYISNVLGRTEHAIRARASKEGLSFRNFSESCSCCGSKGMCSKKGCEKQEKKEDDVEEKRGYSKRKTGYSRRVWTKEDDEFLKKMVDSGKTNSFIAKKMKRTKGAISTRIYNIGSFRLKNVEQIFGNSSRKRWTSSDIEKMKKMLKNGCTNKEIAKILHRTKKAVSAFLFLNHDLYFKEIPSKKNWDEKDEKMLRKMLKEGSDFSLISSRMRKPIDVIYDHIKEQNEKSLDSEKFNLGKRWTKEDDETMFKMIKEKYSHFDIAKAIGRTKGAVDTRVYVCRMKEAENFFSSASENDILKKDKEDHKTKNKTKISFVITGEFENSEIKSVMEEIYGIYEKYDTQIQIEKK